MEMIYGSPEEDLDPNDPPPLGELVRTSTFADANLMHDYVTGRACSGIIHFVNQTPVECFSKCQNTVETSSYGSEFIAARIATEKSLIFILHCVL